MALTNTTTPAPETRLGAQFLPETGQTRFRVWTVAQQVAVRIGDLDYPLEAQEDGFFEAVLPFGVGTRYRFVLDAQVVPDPYARFLPEGVHGEAEVVNPEAYLWQDDAWMGRPLSQCVFYELHIGTFTPEGTYRAAQEKLPYLRDLGITALQLMPLAAFDGRRGWGYDGVALYAPFAPYGRPEDLMAFVDAAHAHGLAVCLDAVYNHFGPAGNYLSDYHPNYFTERQSEWGAGLNFSEAQMRRYVLGSARMWLRDYHFDGLRLDATQSMWDDSVPHILQEMAAEVHKLGPKLLLAEDYRNLPELMTEYGLDGVWVDDFHHEVRVSLTGERDGYYAPFSGGAQAVAHAINRGWVYEGQIWPLPDERLPGNRRGKPALGVQSQQMVYFIQNHDQIGNRAIGDRMHHLPQVSAGQFRAASLLLLTLPTTPLLFMGQEWAASTPFPFFSDHAGELGQMVSEGRKREFAHFEGFQGDSVLDPQAPDTFRLAQLDWAEANAGEHALTLRLYHRLLELRRTDAGLSDRRRENLSAGHVGDVLWVRHHTPAGERVTLWNMGRQSVSPRHLDLGFALPPTLLLHCELLPDETLEPGEAGLWGGQ